jgi:MFS superfamily sulfate permease-like transporter
LGQKYYPIPYNLLRCIGYPLLAVGLVYFFKQFSMHIPDANPVIALFCLMAFLAIVWMVELRKKSLISSQT